MYAAACTSWLFSGSQHRAPGSPPTTRTATHPSLVRLRFLWLPLNVCTLPGSLFLCFLAVPHTLPWRAQQPQVSKPTFTLLQTRSGFASQTCPSAIVFVPDSGQLHFRTTQAYPAPYSRSKREISPLHSQSSWVAYFHWLYVSPPSHSSTHASLASAPNTPVHTLLVESLMIVLLPNPVCPSSIFLTGFLQWFSSFMKHCVLALLLPHHSPVFLPWITGRTPAFLPDQCRKGSHGRKGQLKAHWALPHLLKL